VTKENSFRKLASFIERNALDGHKAPKDEEAFIPSWPLKADKE
jgi:hypothetical protein